MKFCPRLRNSPWSVFLIAWMLWPAFLRAATIDSFAPQLGPAGTQVEVTGTGFTGTTVVQIGTVYADFSVVTANLLRVVVPPEPLSGPLRVTGPGGTLVTANWFYAPPRIDDFDPPRAGTNTPVTINGVNFHFATAVQFNGSNAAFTVTAPTQIRATIPYGAASGFLTVATPAGQARSSAAFQVSSPAPIVDALVPAIGAPGAPILILGANFANATKVTFNGTVANFAVTADTQIAATVPAAATTGPLVVTTAKGSSTNLAAFTVTRAPVITNFYPAVAAAGASVTIEGINFSNVSGISFNGRSAAGFGTPAPGQITAVVPSGATSGFIRVTNSFGTGVSAAAFTVTTLPIIDTFTPDTAAPGADIVIDGLNFTGTTAVRFNGKAATSLGVTAPTQLHAKVPPGATTGPVAVQNASGSTTSSIPFTVIGSAPFVTQFSPSHAPPGATLLIEGLNFINVTSVKFNGTNAASFNAPASSQINAVVPAGATTGPLTVTTTAGTYTTSNVFHAPPRVTAFSPELAVTGTQVTLAGTNLAFTTGITVGGISWPFAVVDARTLKATVPSNAWDGVMQISTPGGDFITTNSFRVTPQISSFAPGSGEVGTTVTITGSGFTGTTAVSFGGAAAIFQVDSATQITAVLPSNARTGTIQVSTANGTAVSSAVFTVTGASDLAVNSTLTPALLSPGQTSTWHVVIANQGSSTVSGLRCTNIVAAGLTVASTTATNGTLSRQGNVVFFDLPLFAAEKTTSYDIVVVAPAAGSYTNVATVTSDDTDPTTSNNRSTAILRVATAQARLLQITAIAEGTQLVLSWPTSAIPFSVQSTPSLAAPMTWTAAPGAPVAVSGQWRLTNAVPAGGGRFYRLIY